MSDTRFIRPLKEITYDLSEDETIFEERRQKSVLLVEDDVELAELLREHLNMSGYGVTIAADGVQGMRRILEKDFDAIVCDLMMPNLPGDMFYRGVERVKPQLLKRFIFITGHQGNPKFLEFIKQTRCLTLFKPFPIPTFLDAIKVVTSKAVTSPPKN